MVQVITNQPSASSPYQPTALQEDNDNVKRPRIQSIDSEQFDRGCCSLTCRLLLMCCQRQGIKNRTKTCCEDKRKQRVYNKGYRNSRGSYNDNAESAENLVLQCAHHNSNHNRTCHTSSHDTVVGRHAGGGDTGEGGDDACGGNY